MTLTPYSRDTGPVTNRQPTTRLGWWRLLLAAIAAVVVVLLGAGTASAVTAPNLETRVGASTVPGQIAVGPHVCITAGQQWVNAPPQAETTVATGVAAKTSIDLVPYRAWPEGEGFLGGSKVTVLKPGTLIDRYGSDGGRFVSPEGTPFGQRGLPSTRAADPYSVFEVQKRTVVRGGTVVPWADSGGGGVQYKLPASVQDLLDAGYLSRIGQ